MSIKPSRRGDHDYYRTTTYTRVRQRGRDLRTPVVIIGFGCLIAMMSFGPRSSLGFFLTPLSNANHWGRDVFAFALALQNLLWGVGQPIAGAIADRFGTARALHWRSDVCSGVWR